MSPSRSDDLDALRGLETSGPDLPAGLSVQWLGVSGYRLTFEGVSLFIDPYLSRVPLRSLLLRRPAVPDAGLIERYAGSAAGAWAFLRGKAALSQEGLQTPLERAAPARPRSAP